MAYREEGMTGRVAIARLPTTTEPDAPVERPKVTWGLPYSHPSEGSTLKLLTEPSRMTGAQVLTWADFNRR